MNDDRGWRGQDSTEFGADTRQGQDNGQYRRTQPGGDGFDGSPWPSATPRSDYRVTGEAGPGFGEQLAGEGDGTPYGYPLSDGDGNGRGPAVAEGTGGGEEAGGLPGAAGPGVAGPGRPDQPEPPGPKSHARGHRRRKPRRAGRSWWIELPILLVFALVLALLIKSFVVQAFFIPSGSMENTLLIGDKVLVNKLVYDFRSIHRGDIVVFNGDGSWDTVPLKPKPPLTRLWDSVSGLFGTAPGVHDYIKRVIGVPGDHVVCCDPQGRVTVNGVPLSEKSYIHPGNVPSVKRFSITVPQGRLWVMGDNRSISFDSRDHQSDPGQGTVPENKVVGRAFLIVAPFSRWHILPIPTTFEQPALNKTAAAVRPPGGAAIGALAGPLSYPGGSLVAGLAGALPLTWLQRRLRRRLGRRLQSLCGWLFGLSGRRGPG